MKTVVVQFDTREEEVHCELANQNREYAAQAGYAYEFIKGDIREINPFWGKVKACLKVAESGQYDRMLFLDSDAAVMDFGFRVEPTLSGQVLFAGSGTGGFNAGIFAMNLGDEGTAFLREWMGHYKQDAWWTNGKEWKTTGKWAGPDYEQGSLNMFVTPNYGSRTLDVGWKTFLHCDHHRTLLRDDPHEGGAKNLGLKELQLFARAMAGAKVVHFCGRYKFLIPFRWSAFEGRLVLFDDTADNKVEEMMKAMEICREAPE